MKTLPKTNGANQMTLLCMELSSTWTNCCAAALNKARSAAWEKLQKFHPISGICAAVRLEIETMEILEKWQKKNYPGKSLAIFKVSILKFYWKIVKSFGNPKDDCWHLSLSGVPPSGSSTSSDWTKTRLEYCIVYIPIGLVYLPTRMVDFMVIVGKYTIPMDAMGVHVKNLTHFATTHRYPNGTNTCRLPLCSVYLCFLSCGIHGRWDDKRHWKNHPPSSKPRRFVQLSCRMCSCLNPKWNFTRRTILTNAYYINIL